MMWILSIGCAVFGALAVLLGFLLLGLLRAFAHLSWRMDNLEAIMPSKINRSGLRPGRKAPEFVLPGPEGKGVSLGDFAGRRVLLVFAQPGCGPCQSILPELNAVQKRGACDVLVVFNGASDVARHWAKQEKLCVPVLAQERFAVSKLYEAFATPFAFLIDETGIVRSRGIVSHAEHLQFILDGGVASSEELASQVV